MRVSTASIAYVALLLSLSCQTIVVDFENGAPPAAPQQKESQASLWFGIQELTQPVAVACPRGPAKVAVTRTPLDFLIHFTIGGVYSTRTTEVYCSP